MAGNLARGNDLNIGQGSWLKGIAIGGVVFLILPLIILVVFSFNDSRSMAQWHGFSLVWYRSVLHDPTIWLAVKNSLIIAIVSTLFTLVLATMGAMLLARHRFRGREFFQNLLYVPVILPEIIMGVSLLAIFMLVRFPLGLVSIICGHITFSFPFVTLIILARIINLPPSLEEASMDLGAGRWQTFVRVVLPNITPGLIAGALFAFTLSIDDFVITFFTAGVGSSTLPLKIYSLIKFGITPAINAISTILILFTIQALYLVSRLQKSQRIGRKFKLGLAIFSLAIVLLLFVAPYLSAGRERLYIYNYSEYLDMSLVREFEQETGIRVTLDYFNDNEELLSRLQMGVVGYDLVFPTSYMVSTMKQQGLLQPIDLEAIPNYAYIDTMFTRLPFDTTGRYYVPYTYGYTAIVYNSERVEEPVDSWEVLWDSRYTGRISMLDDVREVFYVAYRMLGWDMEADTRKLNEARDLLIQQKPLLRKYESYAVELMMSMGEVWLAHAWNGQIVRLAGEDPKFKLALPVEGFPFWIDNFCIPAGAPNKANAERFIDFMLRPEHAARNMASILYAMPHEAARLLLEPEMRENEILFPDLSGLERLELMEDLGPFNRDLDRAWTEVKVR